MGRCYAFNAVSLVDFVTNELEKYYKMRLRKFAHGRLPYCRLILEKLYDRATSQFSKEDVETIGDGQFLVPSSQDPTRKYVVDSFCGICTCEQGICGKFCKHMAAVQIYQGSFFPNAPSIRRRNATALPKSRKGRSAPSPQLSTADSRKHVSTPHPPNRRMAANSWRSNRKKMAK